MMKRKKKKRKTEETKTSKDRSLFYGISTFVGYLMPKPFF